MSAVELTREGSTARLVMNRPEVHNAFDDGLIADLTAAIDELDRDDSVRAVVLTGAGASFSAGADLHWMRGMAAASEADNLADSLRLATLMRRLQFLSKPTIARINGAAFGGGVGLIACCDIAVAVEGARFALSEVKLGLVPAVISPYVVAAIGLRQSRRLFLTGEIFDSAAALAHGLVHEVVPGNDLDGAVDRLVGSLSKGGPAAQREAKSLALSMGGQSPEAMEKTDAVNAALIAKLRVSAEGQDGLSAFLDKASPSWLR
ncbi:enoyl-CoA hydratase/isomerase family protein [Luteibacter sp. 9133]|uniref:enoyl-CoA hydratase/isomerase family protein n=1 Tax=Luteibacter sp. 9133 TaxID=1500891 RepID=UPI0005BD7B4F|nr:enoyl-CoA hydratase/isomerase family protein [Luteibacter sp. 9133]